MLTAEDVRKVVSPPVAVGLRQGSPAREGPAASRRAVEFALGREAAVEALVSLGFDGQAIPTGPRGAPFWPDGVVGSITHTADIALAVSARASDRAAIGIDVERQDRHVDARTLRRFCTPLELILLSAQNRGWLTPLMLFCAKEATYKALGRFMPRWVSWRDVVFRVDGVDRLRGELSARVATFAPVVTVSARVLVAGGFVVACVEIPAANDTGAVPSGRAGTVPDAPGSH